MQKNQKLPYFSLLCCFFLFLGGVFMGRQSSGTPILHTEHQPAAQIAGETDRPSALETTAAPVRSLPREDGRIHLNTATAEELKTLPGVGDVLARRILDYRDQNGPFRSPEELMNVKGIGEKIYAGLQDLIDLGGTP